jgi:predicted transcriptional regulator
MDVRKQIKMIIKDRALIQAEIARRSDMTPDTLYSILALRRKLGANDLINICKALNMAVEEVTNYNSNSVN